jgi:hypothetical protein
MTRVAADITRLPDEPGGMMRYGIPAHGLPRDVMSAEIARASGRSTTCGLLSVPPETDAGRYERSAYVHAMRAANAGAYNPW